ncbi:BnaC02g43090D [Brassica napus]|uniref:BnaC02g43090D protein n=1 Tax=Brassica napus TaxID=3708 RepID=A0A078IA97_BRANA|nr:BnaC02g43090D [Brassica napus]
MGSREAAAASLVTRLQEIKKQYETLPDKESIDRGLMLEAEKNDGLDNCAPHLRYALRRVIRGVSSSRDRISVESLLKLVSDNLSVSSSMKGQDVKESLLGRLFAYGALARSGRLIEDWQTDKDSQIIKEFTNDLISLAAKKRYLQEPGVHVLLDFIEKVYNSFISGLNKPPSFYQFLSVLACSFLKIISSVIGNCLKESTFCQPRVHSLWSIIRDLLLPEAAVNELWIISLSADANKCHALRHLVVQLLLKIFLHPGEFSEAASELSVCCDKAFSSSLDLLESDGEGEDDGEEEPTVMDVLVDTPVFQTSRPVFFKKKLVKKIVFKYFYQDVTSDGLLRMLRVIKKNLKLARHQDDLDDDEEDCLAIEDEEEEDENEEMGETGEHVDHMAVDMEKNKKKKMMGWMTRQCSAWILYLAQIFKEKKNQSGGETAQSQLVLSKLHVLSLLEIYLHENPGNPQVMTVYLNLAQAPVNPSTAESSQQLLNRICGIIYKKIFKSRELFKDGSLELSALASLLEKNLKLAAKPFKSKKNLAQNSTYWVLKIIDSRGFSETELEMVLDVFRMVLFGYFDSKKSQIKVDFLEEVFRRRAWIARSHARCLGFLWRRV